MKATLFVHFPKADHNRIAGTQGFVCFCTSFTNQEEEVFNFRVIRPRQAVYRKSNQTKPNCSFLPTKLTTWQQTKITLQTAHTRNSPTEICNGDVQHITITILHTKKVSVAGSGGVRKHEFRPGITSQQGSVYSLMLSGQLQVPPANGPIANCHPSQSGTHTPDKCQSIITGFTNTLREGNS